MNELLDEVEALRQAVELARRQAAGRRVFAADAGGGIVATTPGRRPASVTTAGALVVWRPPPRP